MSEFPAMKDALGKLDAARKSLKSVFDEAGPDMDMSKVKSMSGDSKAKVDWIRGKNDEIKELKDKVEELKALEIASNEARKAGETPGDDRNEGRYENKSIGDLFVESEAFGTKERVSHLDVELKTEFGRPPYAANSGWAPESVRSGRLELTPQRPDRLVVPHIPSGSINQPLYKYMSEKTFATNEAGGTNLAGFTAEGNTFTEAQLELEEKSQAVEKLTVWIPMTDEQLEDVAAARSYVQQRLTYMMYARLDSNVMIGTGANNQLLGTENVPNIQTQAKGADTLLDATYKLFTSIRTLGFAEPSVAFVNPGKWQEVALLKTADGQYIWNHPSSTGPVTAWGVPVVLTTAHTSTKLVTGDYAAYAQLFHKRGLDVQVTNSHSDFFIKGKQAIRMDMRMVLVHFRPGAFGVVTGL